MGRKAGERERDLIIKTYNNAVAAAHLSFITSENCTVGIVSRLAVDYKVKLIVSNT